MGPKSVAKKSNYPAHRAIDDSGAHDPGKAETNENAIVTASGSLYSRDEDRDEDDCVVAISLLISDGRQPFDQACWILA